MPVTGNPPAPTLTQRGQDSLLDYVENIVDQGFNDALDAATDLPAFLAGPPPTSPSFLPLYGIGRQACRTYARGFGPQNLPGFDAAWGGLCEPFLDDIGEAPTGGMVGPQFLGGQCDFGYVINWNATNENGVSFDGGPQNFPGPITPEFWGTPGPADAGTPVDNCDFFGGTFRRYQLLHAPTQTRLGLVIGCNATLNSFSATPVGGVPDVCGNPPVVYDPPRVVPGLPPLSPTPIDVPGIGPVDIDVTFGPDGEILIGLPDLGLEVNVGNPFDPATEGGEGGPPLGPGDGGAPVSSGSGGDSEGEAPAGQELVGLQVEVLEAPENANTFDNVSQTVYRGIGYVRMGYPGRLGIDISGGTVLAPQFFHAQQRGLTAWAVRANVGFNLRTTPYYREATE